MKRIIAFVLILVLVFSFSVSAFAVGNHNSELDALNNIDYYVYWIFDDFTDLFNTTNDTLWDILSDTSQIVTAARLISNNLDTFVDSSVPSILSNLVDINEYTRENNTDFNNFVKNFLGEGVYLEPFGVTVLNSLSALTEVLADPDDVALKESQKDNQEAIQNSFFNPESNVSVTPDKIDFLSDLSGNFVDSFDFSDYVGNTDPFSYIGEGSEALSWFTNETGLNIDPSFGSSSGDGPIAPPPTPSNPIVAENILPYAESEYFSGTIFNGGLGYKNNSIIGEPFKVNASPGGVSNSLPAPDSYSSEFAVTGFIDADFSDTFYFYNVDVDTRISYALYTGSGLYDSVSNFQYGSVEAVQDSNGVYKVVLPDSVSTTQKDLKAVRFVVSSFDSDSFISRNEYPLQSGEPLPYVNLLPTALEFPGLNSVLGDNGVLLQHNLSGSSYDTLSYVSSSSINVTGFMPFYPGRSIYISSDLVSGSNMGVVLIDSVNQQSSTSVFFISNLELFNGFYIISPDDLPSLDFTPNYFCLRLRTYSSDGIICYTLPPTSSTFSLRSSRPGTDSSSDVVTNYVDERNDSFWNLLGVNK